jgi:hypothetical protein
MTTTEITPDQMVDLDLFAEKGERDAKENYHSMCSAARDVLPYSLWSVLPVEVPLEFSGSTNGAYMTVINTAGPLWLPVLMVMEKKDEKWSKAGFIVAFSHVNTVRTHELSDAIYVSRNGARIMAQSDQEPGSVPQVKSFVN